MPMWGFLCPRPVPAGALTGWALGGQAAKTGESYTTALRHVRPNPVGDHGPGVKRLRLAVAQTIVREDPRSESELRDSAREIRRLMREAHAAGARLVHFPEGATCFPHKRIMSVDGPERVGPADWGRVRWDVLRSELTATAGLAGALGLWTVLGSAHQLTPPNRPHNSRQNSTDDQPVVQATAHRRCG